MNKTIKEHKGSGGIGKRLVLRTDTCPSIRDIWIRYQCCLCRVQISAYLYVLILSLAFTFPSFALLYGGQREGLRGEVIYSYTQIIKCIISEAIGEREEGQIAVAFVFKARLEKGMSLGSCGYKRKDIDEFIARQPKGKVDRVKFIWNLVKQNKLVNPVPDCTHFESIDFPTPKWSNSMKKIKQIGKHIFWKDLTNE